MKLELIHVRRLHTKDSGIVSFEIPLSRKAEYAELIKKGQPVDRFDLRIEIPRKRRSTGFRSQNSHSHGHYADIAEQLSTADVDYSPDEIARALKLMAMKEGYWPPKMNRQGEALVDPITKALEPMSESDADTAQAGQLIEFIHQWADTNGLWLTEYIDEEPRRVYGGAVRQA
jgi:hypothetical protein